METHTVDLPDFYCPIPSARHPAVDRAESRTGAWVQDLGLAHSAEHAMRLRGNNCADLYGRITPHGDEQALQIAVDWHSMGFAFDDEFVDTTPHTRSTAHFSDLAGRLLLTLEHPNRQLMPEGPYHIAVKDLAERYRRTASSVQYQRWVEAQRKWLLGSLWMMSADTTNALTDPNSYLAARIQDSGGAPATSMIELVTTQEIPEGELWSAPTRALTEIAHMIAILDNELVSRYKEEFSGQRQRTLIDVVARHHHWTPEAAQQAVIGLRDQAMTLFLNLSKREDRRPGASSALRAYLTDLGHLIRGNIDWSLACPRYSHLYPPGHNVPVAHLDFHTRITDQTTTAPLPLRIPAVAWWTAI
ncbi:terpene synthase family protein [Streptomyces wuyuanensis]|uniref:terpene synthase family protein n=1 Tax=Streptomyces wuyuanensis TaxID=1196353 RepID=UPI00343A6F35